jgi:hypothetical protein
LELPEKVVPVDKYDYQELVFVKFALPTGTINSTKTKTENKWRHDILGNIIVEDETELRRVMADPISVLNIVSDGGVHTYQSNYGLVIAQKLYSLATNMGKIYSMPFHKSSYRSEMFGMLAAVVSVRHILETFNITMPPKKKLCFHCDNKSVVKTIKTRLELRRTVNEHRYPDVDI